MNKLLSNSSYSVGLIMAPRRHTGAGIRWSSYVGDLRYIATGSSYNISVNYNNNCNNNKSSSNINFNKEQREARKGSMKRGGVRTFSTTSAIKQSKQHLKATAKLSTSLSTAQQREGGAPHERLLILGSGVAGCSTALTAARYGIPVTVLHAGSNKNDCNSYWAQGGVIYRNYRLLENNNNGNGPKDEQQKLVDTPLSLVNDIRIASGYTSPLQRSTSIEECTYSSHLHQNTNSKVSSNNNLMGKQCPKSGVQWNEDAAWKLACEGPSRIRELLLGTKDEGLGETHGCVVPFDRTTLPTSNENDDNDGLGKDVNSEEDDVLSLCLEASHAAPRIIHYADCTGKVITENITKAAAEHPLIEFVGDSVVTDLILDENSSSGNGNEEGGGMVIGAQVLDKSTNQLNKYYAVHGVVLASGGLAGIYQHSTNPLGFNALGSSVGLALRMQNRLTPPSLLGGRTASSTKKNKGNNIVSDLEYVQFHPTSLYLPNEARFLLTEALRGEGAILRDLDGRAFAHDYHPNGELAPRDIVARAVFCESQKTVDAEDAAQHNAYLDITHRDSTWLKDRFPSIDKHLMSRDTPMDFTKERIPIIPAAHYTCGGVTTDLNGCVVGNRNLYAAGEAARTGLHGGNRLASTSLLEGLVYGASVGEMVAGVVKDESDTVALEEREKVMETMHHARHAIEQRLVMEEQQQQLSSSPSSATADERITQEATSILAHLKSLMWDNVGVVRTPTKLDLAVSELTAIRDQADRLWEEEGAGWEVVALRDAAHAGLAVADAALANRVSGGAHHVVLDGEEEDKDGSDDDEEVVLARA